MSYIKLKVQSGGIYIRQKKDYNPINLDFTPHPVNNNQKVLSLVRENSIKGLFSYLIGETKQIKDIEKSTNPSVQKLNSTLKTILHSVAYEKISEPHITTFFERKDSCNKESQFKTNPKVNLYQHNFKTADSTIKLLEKPLTNIMEKTPNSLGDIHSFFKHYEVNKKNAEEYNKIRINKKKLDLAKIPESKLKTGIKTALQRIEDNKTISSKVIKLIEEICLLCEKDNSFYNKVKNSQYGKFSIFTDLSNTKHWVDKSYHSIVRGTPSYIACVDFNVYLSKVAFEENKNSDSLSWEELVDKLRAGPNIARWGEGGVVFIKYDGLDAMSRGYQKKDQMFVEIKALRNAGLKIKKYGWEETADKNKKN